MVLFTRINTFNYQSNFALKKLSNFSDVMDLAVNEKDREKVRLILDEIHPGDKRDVPDPYYGGTGGFDNVYAMLDEACDRIANRLSHE